MRIILLFLLISLIITDGAEDAAMLIVKPEISAGIGAIG